MASALRLALPQLPPCHNQHASQLDPVHLTDAPRLLAALRPRAAAAAAARAAGPAAAAAAPPAPPHSQVHVVAGEEGGPPEAYVLVEESNHAGPRFGIIARGPRAAARRGSARALQELAALRLEQLRFFGLPEAAVEAADDLLPRSGYVRRYHNPCWQYVLPQPLAAAAVERWRDEARRLGERGYRLSELQPSDAETVDARWPYRSAWSLPFIQTRIIGRLATACARDAAGRPVAWAVEYEDGSFGMLHTEEDHRRRGLGRLVLVALVQRLVARGALARAPLFAYVVDSNEPSRRLLRALGFQETAVFSWQGWERDDGAAAAAAAAAAGNTS
ncbi:hypothetical protein Rsub_08556 [Raphidocelis subcapitata]|uniref:N-acetyltransferase domain-containing protein n=1 Tax=Raphidocelis subcapitata TaxID=307507 RepID=A0A2V0PEQ7_9CHLO|nr:hypothetical protein Rsub_08556 [Raphidocelis subcapitata]|eukprot:GBF95575.1 hypothetical protein Rsub_08556 [Raphidocelis subcapitata]